MRFSSFLPFGLLALASRTDAAHLRLSGRPRSTFLDLGRRASLSGTMSTLNDSQNMVYTTNITLNGARFSVMIDTGSSDLWVSDPVPDATSENFQAGVTYASGSASGDVMSATLDFAGFTIQSQFFIEAPDGDAAAGADGLIGLGPGSGSNIVGEANSTAANQPLDRIFTSNSSISPFIAILLQRSDDPDERYPGDLAVGDVVTEYQDILNQPHLPVSLVPLEGGQHWQTFLDVNGIIGPNGQPIEIKTQVTGAQTENATVIFDTGFTLPQVSSDVAQALYGDIPGAALTNITDLGEIWTLPCDQEVNATFLFAGVEFPIHPLDLNSDDFGLTDDNGQTICAGAFQPYSFDIDEGGDILFDMILGMGFLRNSYILINFGNLVNAATPSTDTAYIQLLPITNATQAAQDFATVRSSNGTDSDSDDGEFMGSSQTSTSSSGSFLKHGLIAVIVGAGVLLILLVAGITVCRRRRRNQNASASTAWVANPTRYQPIHRPSPQGAYDMHMVPGTQPGYNSQPGYNPDTAPEYRTAWDSRY